MNRLLPKQIDVEVTSECNLRCKYCPAWQKNAKEHRHIDPELFYSIIDRYTPELRAYGTVLVPWLNGEPLLHPNYTEMILYAAQCRVPMYITTNGTIWNQDLFELILDSSCYQIIFSVDGLWDDKSPSIELARPGSDRDLIRWNIERFLALKIGKGSKIDVALKICRRGQDWEEIEEYITYWLTQPGVNYVCVGDALTETNTGGMRVYPCQYSDNNFMVIKSDGALTFCAYNDQMTNDRSFRAGRMDLETPLVDLYNSPVYTNFRNGQRAGRFHPVCKTCGFAYTGAGLNGVVHFRDGKLGGQAIFYHRDYYNSFFSLTCEWKPESYYGYRTT